MRQERVMVLMGGVSPEREISLRSGKAAAAALRERFEHVTELDLTPESLPVLVEEKPDVAFIALHGVLGEDGALQGLLEWRGIPYTGPGVAASALCMDKITTKMILRECGVATAPFLALSPDEDAKEAASRALAELGLPLVLKSCRQGSSIGTAIVRCAEEAAPTLRELFALGDPVLAEKFLSGTELSIPVLGNDALTALPVIEIVADGEFYDFESKYTPGKSRHVIPARISPAVEEKAKELAFRSFRATGCRGIARVDLMLDGTGEPFVIELNTIPGMTETSLVPDAARHAGMSFGELAERLVDLALEKRA